MEPLQSFVALVLHDRFQPKADTAYLKNGWEAAFRCESSECPNRGIAPLNFSTESENSAGHEKFDDDAISMNALTNRSPDRSLGATTAVSCSPDNSTTGTWTKPREMSPLLLRKMAIPAP